MGSRFHREEGWNILVKYFPNPFSFINFYSQSVESFHQISGDFSECGGWRLYPELYDWLHKAAFSTSWWPRNPQGSQTHATFGQCDGPKVIGIHDLLVQLQRNLMGRPLHLHAGIVYEDVHTAIAIQDLSGHILDTADI